MSVTFGPSTWWIRSKEAADYYARICPVGTVLGDCSVVWCKTLGQAWIVSPPTTMPNFVAWAGGQYNNICVTPGGVATKQICCICEWPSLCNCLISNGFNPCDWFVPDSSIMGTMINCRCFVNPIGNICGLWTSTETSSTSAVTAVWIVSGYTNCVICCGIQKGGGVNGSVSSADQVRAIRCITL